MLYVFNEFLQIYYQTILETMLATLDTILEFFALLIPITFLLMHYYGIHARRGREISSRRNWND